MLPALALPFGAQAVFIALTVLTLALAAYVLWAQTHWARRGVPHVRPVPVLGNLWDCFLGRQSQGEVLHDIYRRFDGQPYVGLYNALTPVLVLRDATLVKEVLVQNFASFANNEIVFPAGRDEVLSENPFTADTDRWKGLRARMTQAFSPARVRMTFGDLQASSEALVALIKAQGEHASQDVCLLTKRLTAQISTQVLFGIDAKSLAVGGPPGVFYEMGHNIFNGGSITALRMSAFFNCPALLPLVGYGLVSSDTVSFFRKLIRDSIEFRQKEGIVRDDFVHSAAKEIVIDGKIDEGQLRAMSGQVINSFLETFETSALTTANALVLLATNPHFQEELRDELRDAFPKATLDHDKLVALPFLDQIIKETLRFIPAAETLRRTCTKATTLQPSMASSGTKGEPRGVALRRGDVVYVPVSGLHRDAAFFSHPDEFWPGHFSEEEVAARPKSVYLAFGDGPRQCPGTRYATLLVKVALATLLLRFEATPGPEQVLPPQRDPASPFLGLKGGVWLRFRLLPLPSS